MFKKLLFVALCCAALASVDGTASFVGELTNPIYGDFSVVLQVSPENQYASLAGVYNCGGDSSCTWTTFTIYSGSMEQYGTPYFDAASQTVQSFSFAVSASPFSAEDTTVTSTFDVTTLQQADLFAVLSGASNAAEFVGEFIPFTYFGIAQYATFEGAQTGVVSREIAICYDTFSGSLTYDYGRATLSASVSHHKDNNNPYPNVNIVPTTLSVVSQYTDSDDYNFATGENGLLLATFSFNGDKITNNEIATSFEAVEAARSGFLNFYVTNSDNSLVLRGQVTSYVEDNQPTIQHQH